MSGDSQQTAAILAQLPGYARLSVMFTIEGKTFYKEDFHQALTQIEHRLSQRESSRGIGFHSFNMNRELNSIIYEDGRMVYGNLGVTDNLIIQDNKVEYHYTEFTDQNIITPIINHFEVNLLL